MEPEVNLPNCEKLKSVVNFLNEPTYLYLWPFFSVELVLFPLQVLSIVHYTVTSSTRVIKT